MLAQSAARASGLRACPTTTTTIITTSSTASGARCCLVASPALLVPRRQQQHTQLQCRAASATVAAALPGTTQLSMHLGETTLQIPFTPQQAQTLDAALSKLLQTFAEMQAAEKRQRWEPMEVRFTPGTNGDEASAAAAGGLELLEVFCNPNTYKSAFDAKLMITARAPGLKVVSEGRLSSVKADVDAFIKDHCG